MSFAGHVFDMINRVKYNNDLKNAMRYRHRKIREAYVSVGRKKGIPLKKLHEISEAELEQFRLEVKKTIARQQRRSILISALILSILLLIAGYLFIKYFLP